MYCKYCGKELDDNAMICPYCQSETDLFLSVKAENKEKQSDEQSVLHSDDKIIENITEQSTATDTAAIETLVNNTDTNYQPNYQSAQSADEPQTAVLNSQPAYSSAADTQENTDDKAGNKKKIIIAVIVIAAIALFFAFKDSIMPFSGTYENINSDIVWQFSGNTYVETVDDDTYTGTFTKEGKRITLTEDDIDVVFIRHGNFIYREDSVSEENFNASSEYVDQNLTFYTDLSDDSSNLYVTIQYSLEDDGSYEQYMTAGLNGNSKTILSGTGTYCVENNFLVFYDDENTDPNKYLIVDNHVYNDVCEKR